MALTVFAHEPRESDQSPQARALRRAARTARESGLRVVALPAAFPDVAGMLPAELAPGVGVYSGPIPADADYRALCEAASARGVGMVNDWLSSYQVTHIALWYPKLLDLTAKTAVVADPDHLGEALDLTFPVFVKGAVKSVKEDGWRACIADTPEALAERVRRAHDRGTVIVARELLDLRRDGTETMGFPHAREYRFVCLDGRPLGHRYYWSESDPLGELAGTELADAEVLACQAAAGLSARLVAVDVGQLRDRSWKVIEVGDAQHAAVGHIPPHRYWTALADRLSAPEIRGAGRDGLLRSTGE